MRSTIACLGAVVVDILMKPIDHYPSPNGLIEAEHVLWRTGGCALNVSLILSKLGRPVSLYGAIAKDPMGQWLEDSCNRQGLAVTFQLIENTATSMTIACISTSGDRSFIHHPGANALFRPTASAVASIASADYLYVGGVYGLRHLDSQLDQLLSDIKHRNPRIVIFLDTIFCEDVCDSRLIDAALPYVDFFLPNIVEARSLSGKTDLSDIGAYFISRGVKQLIVTMGERGIYLYRNHVGRYLPAFDVPVVDTTGAGDSFSAALIAAIETGLPFYRSLQLASAAGALCVGAMGATAGVTNFNQLHSFIKEKNSTVDRWSLP